MANGQMSESATQRLKNVTGLIGDAARDAERAAESIQLVAVSKTHDASSILPVIEAGHRIFGENRVQEAQGKWPDLKAGHPDIELHLIGPLQSNKAGDAVALFDCIQTIDREKIAKAVAREIGDQGRAVTCMVQVNTGKEEQKSGIDPEAAVDFVKKCRDEIGLPVEGLMCIPPLDEEAALHFALLQKLGAACGVKSLSMGMSADFEKAIAYGATHVRVGTAIFGPRNTG